MLSKNPIKWEGATEVREGARVWKSRQQGAEGRSDRLHNGPSKINEASLESPTQSHARLINTTDCIKEDELALLEQTT